MNGTPTKKKVQISLEFAGAVLPVVQDVDGRDIVPFKPIVESIGIDWMGQYRRIQTPYMKRRLGISIGELSYAGQAREMVCIRFDRVSAFMNMVNPDQVRGAGNVDAADFLEAKHAEWDDLIHEYEMRGGIFSSKQSKQHHQYLADVKELRMNLKDLKGEAAERARAALAKQLADRLGIELETEQQTAGVE